MKKILIALMIGAAIFGLNVDDNASNEYPPPDTVAVAPAFDSSGKLLTPSTEPSNTHC